MTIPALNSKAGCGVWNKFHSNMLQLWKKIYNLTKNLTILSISAGKNSHQKTEITDKRLLLLATINPAVPAKIVHAVSGIK